MIENTALFDSEGIKRTRKVAYVKSKSKDGSLTVTINAGVAAKVKKYCRLHGRNCTQFLNEILAERMAELEQTQYDDLSRDDLLRLVKRMENDND
jgi:hypothetical protein